MEEKLYEMRSNRTIIIVTLLLVTMTFRSPYTALAQSESPPNSSGLSPYWSPDVSRWESFILSAAEERNLDPDLIAAVIWKESLGRAWERGPVGAVGLMGVMPFDWRPSVNELQNPWTNIAWGSRALAHTIRDGQGDLYYALAAYNGGWDKIHLRVTRSYAADVLNHYTRAVAMRYGLPSDGDWVAIFATEGAPDPNTITVIGPQRPLARYTARPWVQANIPTVPVGIPPHSTVITCVDEYGVEYQVNVWLVAADTSPIVSSAVQTFSFPSPVDSEESEHDIPHTPTPTVPPIAAPTSVAPNAAPTQPPSPINTPTPMPTVTAVVPTLAPTLQTPPLTPTLTTTQTAQQTPCSGGPVRLSAWDLGKEWTADGWGVTIFVQGHGGDCMYTYAWEGEIKGGPMSDSMTFTVYRIGRYTIMGTASVTSADETAKTGLLLKP